MLAVNCCSKVTENCSADGVLIERSGSVIEIALGNVCPLAKVLRTSANVKFGLKAFKVPGCTSGTKLAQFTPKQIPPRAGLKKVNWFKPSTTPLNQPVLTVTKLGKTLRD